MSHFQISLMAITIANAAIISDSIFTNFSVVALFYLWVDSSNLPLVFKLGAIPKKVLLSALKMESLYYL
jgi:hypothetical protein